MIITTVNEQGIFCGWMIMCQGCNMHHHIPKYWTFNNDFNRPTFGPSIKMQGHCEGLDYVCHFIIKDGMITYCNDCTHELKNQTLSMSHLT